MIKDIMKGITKMHIAAAGFILMEATGMAILLVFLVALIVYISAWFILLMPMWIGFALMIVGSV